MFNRRVGHWLFDAPDRVLNERHKPRCVLQRDRYAGLDFADCRVNRWEYTPAQLDGCLSAHSFIAELALAGRAFDKRHRGRVIDAELALESGYRLLDPRQHHDAWVDVDVNAVNRIRSETM